MSTAFSVPRVFQPSNSATVIGHKRIKLSQLYDNWLHCWGSEQKPRTEIVFLLNKSVGRNVVYKTCIIAPLWDGHHCLHVTLSAFEFICFKSAQLIGVCGPTVADFLQLYCFGYILFIVRCAGFPADFGLEESVYQSGLPQSTLTWKYKKL